VGEPEEKRETMKRRMILLVAVASLLHTLSCGDDKGTGQQQSRGIWEVAIGGESADVGLSVLALEDGGYLVAGETLSFGAGARDAYLIRVDSAGNKSWEQTYGGEMLDRAWSVVPSPQGGFALFGQTTSSGAGGSDFYLVRVGEDGTSLWQQTYGGSLWDEGVAVATTESGGYVLAGSSGSVIRFDIYLVETDAQGDSIWSRTIESEATSSAAAVLTAAGGGYAIGGWVVDPVMSVSDFLLARADSQGEVIWSRSYGGTKDENCNDLLQTDVGGYLLVGWTESFGADNKDVYIVKANAEGTVVWEVTYGGEATDGANAAVASPDGGYLVVGWTASAGAGGIDAYMIKISNDGAKIWERTYGGAKDDRAQAVAVTADGGYIIAGSTESIGAGENDVYLIRTDANGE
jgi:hypothetical protein